MARTRAALERRGSNQQHVPRTQSTKITKASRSRPARTRQKLAQTDQSLAPLSPPPGPQSPPSNRRKREREEPRDEEPRGSCKRPRLPRKPQSRSRPLPPPQSQPHSQPLNHRAEEDPVGYWAREQIWPPGYFERDSTMERVLARKRSSSSLRSRKRSEPGSNSIATPSDQRPREEKSAPYRDPRYTVLLETKGSYMDRSRLGITDESKALCRSLLETRQETPEHTLFDDGVFETTCRKVKDRNEARVIRDINPLLVPSAETLATFGAQELDILIETMNEGWNNSIPLTATRPQPDYSVGFRRSAFTTEQVEKLSPFIGNFLAGDQSFFMATYLVYFPFMSCEVKCGIAALDTADRQNAHTMTLATRGVFELLRLVGRQDDVNRQILAFSISHDHESVRIYGHYPEVDGEDVKYYRHTIRKFDFTDMDGLDRWAAYRFVKNVYLEWMPSHFKRICSAIDQLPSHLDFDVPPVSELGLAQDEESRNADTTAEPPSDPSNITPDTSFTGSGRAKRPRRKLGDASGRDNA